MATPGVVNIPGALRTVIEREARFRHETFEATILRVLFDRFEKAIGEQMLYALPLDESEEVAS